ncbi:MAG: dehydrogenase [Planctomycetota bacterium]|nr:MAG: dehydrogenase [Planctomycetota bacterium]
MVTGTEGLLLLYALMGQAAEAEPLPRVPATEPAEAVETIVLQDGFRAELIAAEPLVADPIAMQYDENGLAYVVEMIDYPYSDPSHDQAWQEQTSEPLGRVSVLEDTDGDGVFDKSTVFADELSWPAGIALWDGGVYVAATPDVLYLKDTDGDRKADVWRTVFTGFRKYNVQAVMNNLHWGLDHHIYAAGSGNGGDIRRSEDGEPVRLGRSDFRFDPITEEFEVISGGARFGNTFDDWGNRFLCNIRNPVQHVVLPDRYLQRNPSLPVASALNDVATAGDAIAVYQISPPEPWRVINAARQAADAATNPPHDSTVPSGFVTSSSGVTIYRGHAYPEEYRGNAFIGEVAGNLVMRYRLSPAGVSFVGERAHDGVEFLASTDNWFRPVNFINAPDGTLHVLDMYRETIEHPWSMPDDLKARVDLTSGRDRGRIYRIVPGEYAAGFELPPAPRLGDASTKELVAELENPNAWWRETSHRLIFERQDQAAVDPLRKLLSGSEAAEARLHALWSLHGLGVLTADDLLQALSDADAHVREHAVRLAEPRLGDNPELLTAVLGLTGDEAPRVRFQLALTLGEVDDERVTSALRAIAARDAGDPWTRTAVLSSLSRKALPFVLDVLSDREFTSDEGGRAMIQQLCMSIGIAGSPNEVQALLNATVDLETNLQTYVIAALGAGRKRAGAHLGSTIEDENSPAGRLIAAFLADAEQTAMNPEAGIADRTLAVQLLSYGPYEPVRDALPALLGPQHPAELQQAAILALTSYPQPEVAEIILDRYSSLTPEVRGETVNRLLSRSDWLIAVLDAIAEGTVSPGYISWGRRDIYMNSAVPEIRDRAVKVFAADAPSPRKEVVDEYQSALTLETDFERGHAVFRKECSACHRFGGEGHNVAPSLATVKHRTPAELLLHILDPNREVSPNYQEFVVLTNSGTIHTGIIASETATSITLKQAEGKEQTILRSDVEEIRSSNKSLMPEGLEKKLSQQDLADVISFLREAEFPDK